jgi:hypothetical protein
MGNGNDASLRVSFGVAKRLRLVHLDVIKAREFFQRVALHDKEYADVSERLASL